MKGCICTSCGDWYAPYTCDECGELPVTKCAECHNELEHDIIVNQNIHIVGSGDGRHDTIDADPDAFGMADRCE